MNIFEIDDILLRVLLDIKNEEISIMGKTNKRFNSLCKSDNFWALKLLKLLSKYYKRARPLPGRNKELYKVLSKYPFNINIRDAASEIAKKKSIELSEWTRRNLYILPHFCNILDNPSTVLWEWLLSKGETIDETDIGVAFCNNNLSFLEWAFSYDLCPTSKNFDNKLYDLLFSEVAHDQKVSYELKKDNPTYKTIEWLLNHNIFLSDNLMYELYEVKLNGNRDKARNIILNLILQYKSE